jgi:phosphatidylserine/phosphatidylglycerophosphate/cardiolipin synthase-like enzyme
MLARAAAALPFSLDDAGRWHGRWKAALVAGLVGLLSACGSLPPNTQREASQALPVGGTTLAATTAALRPQPPTSRNASGMRLLGSSETAYGSRLALIAAAEKTLDLQYYSIHYDSSTEALIERLREAAGRGVRIRVLLDDFNSAGLNARVLMLDEVPGIQVRLFNPLFGPRGSQAGRLVSSLFDFSRIQQRMHNKVFIADNALAVTGGRNLGDEYFGQGDKSNFLDLDVLVAGSLVQDLSRSFDRYWNDDLAYPVATLLSPAERDRLRPQAQAAAAAQRRAEAAPAAPVPAQAEQNNDQAASATARAAEPQARTVPGAGDVARQIAEGRLELVWAPAVLLADKPSKIDPEDSEQDPADADGTVVDDLVHLLGRTRQDLLIVSPYFVPGEAMMKTFTDLRQRGVRVRVLTNSLASNDAPLAHVGYARYREALLRAGVELYELQAQGETRRRIFGSTPQSRSSLHAKALVMDGRLLVVGSMNLDLRSALQNTELGLVIRSQVLSKELTENLESTMGDCYRVELTPEGRLRWHAPSHDTARAGQVYDSEPEAGTGLQIMLKLVGPFAPDEML